MHGRMPYINLMPWRQQKRQAQYRQALYLVVLGIGLVLLCCGVSMLIIRHKMINLKQHNQYYQKQLEVLKQKRSYYQRGIVFAQRAKQINQQVKQFEQMILIMPSALQLIQATFKPKEVTFSGIGGSIPLQQWITQLNDQFPRVKTQLADLSSNEDGLKWILIITGNSIIK